MEVFMLKDLQRIGFKGEIVKVSDGYARNFLLPKSIAIEVTPSNKLDLKNKAKDIENRKEVISTKTSMLAEKIKSLKLVLSKKFHDEGRLYGSVGANEIVDLLANEGININKSQVKFNKSIKTKGFHEVTIKLTSKFQPILNLKIVADK